MAAMTFLQGNSSVLVYCGAEVHRCVAQAVCE